MELCSEPTLNSRSCALFKSQQLAWGLGCAICPMLVAVLGSIGRLSAEGVKELFIAGSPPYSRCDWSQSQSPVADVNREGLL